MNGYIAFVLDQPSREKLLKAFPPEYPDVIAHHITLNFGVTQPTPVQLTQLQEQIKNIKVVGIVNHDNVQAAVVSINGKIKKDMSERIYHITISIDRSKGKKPVDSNKVLTQIGFITIDKPFSINGSIQFIS